MNLITGIFINSYCYYSYSYYYYYYYHCSRSYQSASTRIDRVFHSTTDDNTQTKSSSLLTHALLSLNACASVCVEYHNQNLMAWEPLLEPLDWSVDFKLPMMCNSTDGPILWNLEGVLLNVDSILPYDLLKNDHLDDLSNGGVHLDRSAKVRASLRDININVTVALLESLRLTIKSLSKLNSDSVDRSRSKIKEKVLDDNDAADLSMMIIRNDSGLMMKYWCSDISRATDVPPNTEKPLHMDTESGSGSTIKERFLNIIQYQTNNNTNANIHKDHLIHYQPLDLFHYHYNALVPILGQPCAMYH